TCCTTAPKASRPFTLMTGCSGRAACAHTATRKASPMRLRTGMARVENTGATENSASTRRKGHSTGDSQAMSGASEKVIKAGPAARRSAPSADHARDRFEGAAQEIHQRGEHPRPGDGEDAHGSDQLGHEGE